MADKVEAAQDAVLDKIAELVPGIGGSSSRTGEIVVNLAEAYAWLIVPNQPHGGRGSAV